MKGMVHMKEASNKGIVIISILMITVVLLMLASSLLAINYYNLGFTNIVENKASALKIAEAGVAYAIYCLKEDSTWQPPSGGLPMMEIPGRFEITFDTAKEFYSVNNLEHGVRDGAWGGSKVPGYSVDLIVTGILDRGDNKVVKRVRVILQRDFYSPGSFSSGQTSVDANTIDIKKEATADNPSEAGNIHSNSIKSSNNDPAIKTIDSSGTSTYVYLHGGIASAQGTIDIKDTQSDHNLDIENNSSVDRVKQSKNIKPIDIDGTISQAKNNISSGSITSGNTYVIYKDKVEPPLPPSCTVSNGQLHITDNIVFNGNVRFEFDYSYADPSNSAYDPSVNIADGGIYFDTLSGKSPSLYVDQGNLLVAGALKGNGSCYVSGEARFIGESNIVAPGDTGVAILSKKDIYMELPSVTDEALNLNITGLVYSHGNINVDILDPNDPVNPANNFTAGQWPSNWEDIVLSSSGGGGGGGTVYPVPYTGVANGVNVSISTDGTGTFTKNADGSYRLQLTPSGANSVVGSYYISANSNTDSEDYASSSAAANFDITYPGTSTLARLFNVFSGSSGGGTTTTGSGTKIDPDFHITGGIVAIDPNNPVPSQAKPDNPSAGNIHINIGEGKFFIVSSKKYLKLLESSRASGVGFKTILWSEI